jgi:hypothetical protein
LSKLKRWKELGLRCWFFECIRLETKKMEIGWKDGKYERCTYVAEEIDGDYREEKFRSFCVIFWRKNWVVVELMEVADFVDAGEISELLRYRVKENCFLKPSNCMQLTLFAQFCFYGAKQKVLLIGAYIFRPLNILNACLRTQNEFHSMASISQFSVPPTSKHWFSISSLLSKTPNTSKNYRSEFKVSNFNKSISIVSFFVFLFVSLAPTISIRTSV